MALQTSTLENKSEFERRMDALHPRDFEGAMQMCRETIDKVSQAFKEYQAELSKYEGHLTKAVSAMSADQTPSKESEQYKDLQAIPKQRQYVERWQTKYSALSEKFCSFIEFMKGFNQDTASLEQTAEMQSRFTVFQEFKELNTVYQEYEVIASKVKSNLLISIIFTCKSKGDALNEHIYTQETADLYAEYVASQFIMSLHFEMCCLHDLTHKVFSWVNGASPANR